MSMNHRRPLPAPRPLCALYAPQLPLLALGRLGAAEAAGDYYSHCYGLAHVGDLYDERGDFAVSRRNTERALQMAERHVTRFRWEHVMRHGMLTANEDSPLSTLRLHTTRDMEVSGKDKRQTVHLPP